MYNPMLRAFVEVADCGSFTRASENLYLSPTAVMKQMNALEAHLGLHLLVRTPQGVRLTEAGRSVYKDAKYMMQFSKEAVDRAFEVQKANRQVIRVGTSVMCPCKHLMDLWARVSDEHPEFRLKVIPFQDTSTGSTYLNVGKKYDLLTGDLDALAGNDFCRLLQLGEHRFCLAMSKKHRLAGKESISVFDLYGETLMIMRPGNSLLNDRIRRDIETEHPQIRLADAPQFYDVEVFNECEENGFILLTLESWSDIHPSLVTIPFEVPYRIPYGIIYASQPNDGTMRFLKIVSEVLKEER